MIAKGDGAGSQPFAEAVQKEIATRLTEHQYLTWFQRVNFCQSGPDRFAVSVPNRFFMTYLKQRYLPVIAESIETVTSLERPRIDFEIGDSELGDPALGETDGEANYSDRQSLQALHKESKTPTTVEDRGVGIPHESSRIGVVQSTGALPETLPLNPDYTFDQFIVGETNRLAHAASLSVAENPGASYNPLFLYGSVGLGKTHLAQAVAHTYQSRGMKRVVYLSCASFTDDFISAVSSGDLDRFRRRYREADALLIDDIHFLADKERTKEEFFHTFNAIYNQQKQIFLTSDSLPAEIQGLGDRLVSRFKLGLVAQLEAPSLETRVAILIKKAKNLQLDVPTEVAEFIAHRIRDNVRELEGAVSRLHSMVAIERKPLNLTEVRQSLADLLGTEDTRIDLMLIQQKVLEEFDVRPQDLHSSSRTRSVVIPRQICMYLGREYTDLSLGEIGLFFGGRDHSTVLHAIDKIRKLVKTEPRIRTAVTSIERRLK